MKSILKGLFIMLLLFAGTIMTGIPSANAQAYGTYQYCGNRWYAGGCGGSIAPFAIPPGMMGQQFAQGQRIRCSAGDRVVSGLAGAAIANLGAYAFNRFAKHNEIDRTGAGVVGGLLGSTTMCNPEAWDDGEVSQRQVVTNQQYRQTSPQGYVQRSDVESEASICAIDGIKPIRGISREDCVAISGRMTTSVSTEVRVVAQVPQEEASSGCGVKLAGVLVKEITPKEGSTCSADKKAFVEKFLAQCHGKGGSDAADIECGRKIEI